MAAVEAARQGRTGGQVCLPASPSPAARTGAQVPWEHEAPARRDSQDAQGGPGGGRDAGSDLGRRPGPGTTTAQLDKLAREVLERRGARSNFLGYHGFPAVICTSPNNVIVHGIPGPYVLAEGDIISLDCGAIIEGYHGDAAVTVAVGEMPAKVEKLLRVTEESLQAGIAQLVDGNRLHDVGLAVQTVAEGAGFSVVREYVGHAIGTADARRAGRPQLLARHPGAQLRTGMVFAVEPMVNVGGEETVGTGRRLDGDHGGREPLGPFRAHHRRDRRRSRGTDCPRLTQRRPRLDGRPRVRYHGSPSPGG